MAPQTAPDPHALARRYEAAEPSERNYEAICAAVMETARGRWFLAEYARRNRNADTDALLAAIARIEAMLAGAGPAPPFAYMRDDLRALADTIRNARGKFGVSGREWVKTAQVLALLEQLQRCIEHMIESEGGEYARLETEAEPEAGGPPPVSGRAHLTVVVPSEPPPVRPASLARMPEVSALEPEPQKPAPAAPAPGAASVTPGGSGTPALSELSAPFSDTDFTLPEPARLIEPVVAQLLPPAAMLREFERPAAPAQDESGEHVFLPFDDEPAERPLPQQAESSEAGKTPEATPPPHNGAQPSAPGDPLAPIMALSEEERIALFT